MKVIQSDSVAETLQDMWGVALSPVPGALEALLWGGANEDIKEDIDGQVDGVQKQLRCEVRAAHDSAANMSTSRNGVI